MFIKQQIFKNLVTKAWKGQGLRIANMEDAYYIASYAWALRVDKGVFPNKALACIIELIGEMPKVGEAIAAMKERPAQYEMKEFAAMNLGEMYEKADSIMTVTYILYQKKGKNRRVLQDENTGDIRTINDVFIQAISPEDINHEMEGDVSGPYYAPEGDHHFAIWANNRCIFAARFLDDPDPDTEEFQLHNLLATLQLPATE